VGSHMRTKPTKSAATRRSGGLSGHTGIPAMTIESGTVELLVREYSSRFCAVAVCKESESYSRFSDRLLRCLVYHAMELSRQGVLSPEKVIDRVRHAIVRQDKGVQTTTDLLEEVVLAQACLDKEKQARDALLLRLQGAVDEALKRRFCAVGGRYFHDEVEDVWTLLAEPRPRSPARLEEFWGRFPLWWFVWYALARRFIDWRRRVLAEPRPPQEREPEPAPDPEAVVRLVAAFTAAIGDLEPEERLMIWWIDCEKRSQIVLARILNVNPGHLSRRHGKAVRRLQAFAIAYLDENFGDKARDECLEEYGRAYEQVRARLEKEVARWSEGVRDAAPQALKLHPSLKSKGETNHVSLPDE
jgi:hypothetical protein